MKRYLQYEPFNIYQFETEVWEHPEHTHSYFEIIFIRSGIGHHSINGNTFSYETGDVFLLGPEDYHHFEIRERTAFCYIRFTEGFITDQSTVPSTAWTRALEFLLKTPYQSRGSLATKKIEQEMLANLLTVLLHEEQQRIEASYELVMSGIMKAILGILVRNLLQHQEGISQPKQPHLVQDIFRYIRQYVQQPKKLRMECLVERFSYSPGYLSVYFKQQTGESLQQYIMKYKLKLIENRLLFSDLTISQIAYEFGFTDTSHLTKLFNKYFGVGPQRFRKTISPKHKRDETTA